MISPHSARGVSTRSATRSNIGFASCLAFLIGAWLVLSPAIFGYADGDPWWNAMAIGTLLALLGLARAAGALQRPAAAALSAAGGTWLLCSALWLAPGGAASWNLAACGAVVLALAAIRGRGRRDDRRPARQRAAPARATRRTRPA